jgi:hypothetical protein
MISFLPRLYPDESLYSVFSRYHIYRGNLSFKETIEDLFGLRNKRAAFDLPSGLESIINNLSGTRLTVEYLINNHTLFPYYSPFLPKQKAKLIKEQMASFKGNTIHTSAGLNASSVHNNRHFKHCRICVSEDLEKFGETYWHRVHQVPGVFICPMHNVPLLIHKRLIYAYNQHEYVAPSQNVLDEMVEVSYSDNIASRLYEYSKEVEWLLNANVPSFELNCYRDRYIAALQEKGIASVTKRVNQKEWFQLFKSTFSNDLLGLLDSSIDDNKPSWLSMIVQKHRKVFHPIRHILVIKVLYQNLENFFNSQDEYLPFGKGPWVCLNPAASHYRKKVVRDLKITKCYDTKLPVGTFSCSCGFIYSRRGPDRSTEDMYRVGRIKRFGPVWEEKLKSLLKEEKSLNRIALRLNADPQTIKRQAVLLNLEFPWQGEKLEQAKEKERFSKKSNQETIDGIKIKEKRDSWLQLMRNNPECGVKDLRSKDPALYTWLYRNDKIWLNSNLPLKKKTNGNNKICNWKERDLQLLEEVKSIINNWAILEQEKPKRITKTAIAKQLTKPYLITNYYHKIPRTMAYISEKVESIQQFQIRRVKLAVEKLLEQETTLREWKIIEEASLNPKSVSCEVYEFIEKIVSEYQTYGYNDEAQKRMNKIYSECKLESQKEFADRLI